MSRIESENSCTKANKSDKDSRIGYIDSAKGIGILLVVFGHHLLGVEAVTKWIYSFHMPLFFIIMGFLSGFSKSKRSFKETVIAKAKGLLYPYITFTVVILLWYICYYIILPFQAELPFSAVLVRMITTYGYHACWFLPTAFWANVIYDGCKRLRYSQILLAVISLAGYILSVVLAPLSDMPLWDAANYFVRIFIAVSFICLGNLLYKCLNRISRVVELILLFACGIASLLLFKYNGIANLSFSRIGNPVLYIILACAGSIFVILLCKVTYLGKFKLLQYFGKNSLIVMALHMEFPIEIAWFVLGITKISSIMTVTVSSLAAIIIELCIEFLLIWIINKFLKFMISPSAFRKANHV